jgi:hypothetical protein
MERIKNPFAILRRQSYAGIADRNQELTFGTQSRPDGQFAARVFHGLDGVQYQVHEHLLKLYAISQDVRHMFVEF